MQIIPLTKGQITIVDNADFNRFGHLEWFASFSKLTNSYYATRKEKQRDGKWRTVSLTRKITGAPDGTTVDHKNHNTLWNRRGNLRVCTYSQNAAHRRRVPTNNTSGVIGVFWRKKRKAWIAQLRLNGKQVYLGYFKNKKHAIAARISGSAKYHKGFRGTSVSKRRS